MDGVRSGEGESYPGHWGRWEVGGRQSPHRVPMAVCGSSMRRDGERIRSRELCSRTGVARVCGDVGSVAAWPIRPGVEWLAAAKARVNWDSQGRRGRCRRPRRAGDPPTRAKTRRLRVLVVTVRSPRPIRAVQRGRGYAPSPGPPARRRWLRNAPTACGSARRYLGRNGVLDLGVADR